VSFQITTIPAQVSHDVNLLAEQLAPLNIAKRTDATVLTKTSDSQSPDNPFQSMTVAHNR
jgi:hypothetical protein